MISNSIKRTSVQVAKLRKLKVACPKARVKFNSRIIKKQDFNSTENLTYNFTIFKRKKERLKE